MVAEPAELVVVERDQSGVIRETVTTVTVQRREALLSDSTVKRWTSDAGPGRYLRYESDPGYGAGGRKLGKEAPEVTGPSTGRLSDGVKKVPDGRPVFRTPEPGLRAPRHLLRRTAVEASMRWRRPVEPLPEWPRQKRPEVAVETPVLERPGTSSPAKDGGMSERFRAVMDEFDRTSSPTAPSPATSRPPTPAGRASVETPRVETPRGLVGRASAEVEAARVETPRGLVGRASAEVEAARVEAPRGLVGRASAEVEAARVEAARGLVGRASAEVEAHVPGRRSVESVPEGVRERPEVVVESPVRERPEMPVRLDPGIVSRVVAGEPFELVNVRRNKRMELIVENRRRGILLDSIPAGAGLWTRANDLAPGTYVRFPKGDVVPERVGEFEGSSGPAALSPAASRVGGVRSDEWVVVEVTADRLGGWRRRAFSVSQEVRDRMVANPQVSVWRPGVTEPGAYLVSRSEPGFGGVSDGVVREPAELVSISRDVRGVTETRVSVVVGEDHDVLLADLAVKRWTPEVGPGRYLRYAVDAGFGVRRGVVRQTPVEVAGFEALKVRALRGQEPVEEVTVYPDPRGGGLRVNVHRLWGRARERVFADPDATRFRWGAVRPGTYLRFVGDRGFGRGLRIVDRRPPAAVVSVAVTAAAAATGEPAASRVAAERVAERAAKRAAKRAADSAAVRPAARAAWAVIRAMSEAERRVLGEVDVVRLPRRVRVATGHEVAVFVGGTRLIDLGSVPMIGPGVLQDLADKVGPVVVLADRLPAGVVPSRSVSMDVSMRRVPRQVAEVLLVLPAAAAGVTVPMVSGLRETGTPEVFSHPETGWLIDARKDGVVAPVPPGGRSPLRPAGGVPPGVTVVYDGYPGVVTPDPLRDVLVDLSSRRPRTVLVPHGRTPQMREWDLWRAVDQVLPDGLRVEWLTGQPGLVIRGDGAAGPVSATSGRRFGSRMTLLLGSEVSGVAAAQLLGALPASLLSSLVVDVGARGRTTPEVIQGWADGVGAAGLVVPASAFAGMAHSSSFVPMADTPVGRKVTVAQLADYFYVVGSGRRVAPRQPHGLAQVSPGVWGLAGGIVVDATDPRVVRVRGAGPAATGAPAVAGWPGTRYLDVDLAAVRSSPAAQAALFRFLGQVTPRLRLTVDGQPVHDVMAWRERFATTALEELLPSGHQAVRIRGRGFVIARRGALVDLAAAQRFPVIEGMTVFFLDPSLSQQAARMFIPAARDMLARPVVAHLKPPSPRTAVRAAGLGARLGLPRDIPVIVDGASLTAVPAPEVLEGAGLVPMRADGRVVDPRVADFYLVTPSARIVDDPPTGTHPAAGRVAIARQRAAAAAAHVRWWQGPPGTNMRDVDPDSCLPRVMAFIRDTYPRHRALDDRAIGRHGRVLSNHDVTGLLNTLDAVIETVGLPGQTDPAGQPLPRPAEVLAALHANPAASVIVEISPPGQAKHIFALFADPQPQGPARIRIVDTQIHGAYEQPEPANPRKHPTLGFLWDNARVIGLTADGQPTSIHNLLNTATGTDPAKHLRYVHAWLNAGRRPNQQEQKLWWAIDDATATAGLHTGLLPTGPGLTVRDPQARTAAPPSSTHPFGTRTTVVFGPEISPTHINTTLNALRPNLKRRLVID
ncbi:hypothetical protein, partial [Rhizomonospora bruguierae]|uniref:hypothetical protein n=1 Tax=Rhizomonospora bruguierae TaxID=1581705 RepID=UPI001BCE15E4